MSRNNSAKSVATALPPVASQVLPPEDRRTRQEWIQQQLEDRRRRRDREDSEKLTELQRHHEQLWSPFVREVARTHELNIAWKQDKGFFAWDRVLAFEELEALRITGHALATIPISLSVAFPMLTTLSLIACQLEVLPDSIGELSSLTELDLTKNRLTRLPESLTSLVGLQYLNLSSNLLEELPTQFGELRGLSKLWVENNRLTTLPASLARSQAHTANFNNNRLTALPDAIGDMGNLVDLSVNMNQLVEFPDALTKLTQLQTLHASRNKLTSLPRNIGNLTALRELRLDWNQITELPFSFRLLRSLVTLCMERNPLKLPPIEYVAKGVQPTMMYMERSLEEFIRKARRQAVEKLQEVLTFAMKFVDECHKKSKEPGAETDPQDKTDLETLDALFEPRVERVVQQTEKLPFFGVVWDAFFDVVLPILDRRSGNAFQLLTFCSQNELEDALKHYDDFFGPASMRDNAVQFRRCACIDELEFRATGVRKRKVCVPGQVPFKCERSALLVRMTMMTTEEAKDQLASTYLKRKIERLVVKTKRKCVAFINSEDGVAHFEKLARELAKKHCQRRKRVKKLGVSHAKEKLAFEKKMKALRAKFEAFERARDTRRKALEEKRDKLRKERESASDTKKIQRLEAKIADVESELEKEPIESKKMLDVELAMESLANAEAKAVDTYEKAKAREMNDGEPLSAEEDDDSDDEEEANEDLEDEEGEDDEEAGESDEDDTTTTTETHTAEPQTDDADEPRSFFNIDMPDLHVEDYRHVTAKKIENSLGEERVVNEEELLEMYQQQLRDAYVAERCALVEKKATYEFLQMRAVLKRWMGHGTRAIFEGWRDVVRENRANAEMVKQKQLRKKQIEAQNKALAEELARLEARKWAQRVDMYTDAVYFEHIETGETSWTPPQYWEEEQQRGGAGGHAAVPMLKLPPV